MRWSGRYGGRRLREDRDLGLFRKHHAHDLLKGEEMDTRTRALEMVAGAMPRTGVETHVVGVVVAAEGEREPVDGDPVQLASVTICLLDLADQRAVHRRTYLRRPIRAFSRGRRPVMHLDR